MKNFYTLLKQKHILLITILLTILPNFVLGQEIVNFKQRTSKYSPDRKIYSIKGDFEMIGNASLQYNTYYEEATNGYSNMIYSDVDDDPNTLNSSMAELVLSSDECSDILYAGLYWAGRAHDAGNSPMRFKPNIIKKYKNNDIITTSGGTNYVLSINYYSYNTIMYTLTKTNPYHAGYQQITFYVDNNFYSSAGGSLFYDVSAKYKNNSGKWSSIPIEGSLRNVNDNQAEATFFRNTTINTGNGYLTIGGFVRDNTPNQYGDIDKAYILINESSDDYFEKNKVKIKHKDAPNYTEITADIDNNGYLLHFPNNINENMFCGYAEITDYVREYGIGEYTVADIALSEGQGGGNGFFGGWGMIVIYENNNYPWRDITLYDGHGIIDPYNNISERILEVKGFHTTKTGEVNMKIGILAGEGDKNIGGTPSNRDYFGIQNANNINDPDDYYFFSTPTSNANNFFSGGIHIEGNRLPNHNNNGGVDIVNVDVPPSLLKNNQTETKFKFGSRQDMYMVTAFVMAVDAYVPEPEAYNQVAQVDGQDYIPGSSVKPGQEITYKIEIKNKGTEPLDSLKLVIPIPYTTDFVSASAVANEVIIDGNDLTIKNLGKPKIDIENNELVWNIGYVEYPGEGNGETVFATLTYTLRAETDCFVLSNPQCIPAIDVSGGMSGIGATTEATFTDMQIISGYETTGNCVGKPIKMPLNVPLDTEEYLAENCSVEGGENPYAVRDLEFCNVNTESIPFKKVSSNFPKGCRFYKGTGAIIDNETGEAIPREGDPEYTIETGFPPITGTTNYYAIPMGIHGECYFKLSITIKEINSFPEIEGNNSIICNGDLANIPELVITPSDPDYNLYYFATETGGVPELTYPIPDGYIGTITFWVAEGPNPQCISSTRVPITLIVNATPIVEIEGEVGPTCPNAELNYQVLVENYSDLEIEKVKWTVVDGDAFIVGDSEFYNRGKNNSSLRVGDDGEDGPVLLEYATVTVNTGATCQTTFTLKVEIWSDKGCVGEKEIIVQLEDLIPPTLKDNAIIPIGQDNLNLCSMDDDLAVTIDSIKELFTDNCPGDLVVTRTREDKGSNTYCNWSTSYYYEVKDACGNEAAESL